MTTTIQNKLNLHEMPKAIITNVRKWYIENYPQDDLGQEINPSTTMGEIYAQPWRVYDLTIDDSLIRERIFEELSNRHNIDYDLIYYAWVYGKHNPKSQRNWAAFICGILTASECAENQEKIKAGIL